MKAVVIRKFGGPTIMDVEEIERPPVADDEVLVRVRYSSVNPVDWRIRSGSLRLLTGSRFPMLLGFDIAGEVAETGLKATRFETGTRVFGMAGFRTHGAYAEYARVPEKNLAAIPLELDYREAASLPVAGLTAYQGIHYKGRVKKGDSVLINGASGGVGSFAVQIAKVEGANVTGVCGTNNVGLVKNLGADHVFDYRKHDISGLPDKYDLVFDTVGTLSFLKARKLLKESGIHLSTLPNAGSIPGLLLAPFHALSGRGKRTTLINVTPDPADLEKLALLVRERKIIPQIDRICRMEEIQLAHARSETGRAKGKILIEI